MTVMVEVEGQYYLLPDLPHTSERYGAGADMISYCNYPVTVSRIDSKGLVKIYEDDGRYNWYIKDFISEEEWNKLPKPPAWIADIKPTGYHYCHYNDYYIHDKKDGIKSGRYVHGTGSCFENYESVICDYADDYRYSEPNTITWFFQKRGNEGVEPLSKAERYRWFLNWKLLGALAVSPKKLADTMEMTLSTRMNIEELYLNVCIGRYITEQPDTIRYTFMSMDKYNFRFLTATTLVQLRFGNRSHQIIDRNMFYSENIVMTEPKQIALCAYNFGQWLKNCPREHSRHIQYDLWDFWSAINDKQPDDDLFYKNLDQVEWDTLKYWDYEAGEINLPKRKAA